MTPTEERWRDVYEALGTGRVSPKRLRSFLTAHNVDIVVVPPGTSARARRATDAAAGVQPAHSLDALVYRLHPRSVQTPRPDG